MVLRVIAAISGSLGALLQLVVAVTWLSADLGVMELDSWVWVDVVSLLGWLLVLLFFFLYFLATVIKPRQRTPE